MKINKTLVALAAISLCAMGVKADETWVETGPSEVNVHPGASGTSVFTFTETQGNAETLKDIFAGSGFTQQTGPGGIFASFDATSVTGPGVSPVTLNGSDVVTAGGAVTLNTPFYVTVAWTVQSTGVNPGDFSPLTAYIDLNSHLEESVGTSVGIATVPEPAQTVAGAMLLGCGGLIFAGRRLLKKQAA